MKRLLLTIVLMTVAASAQSPVIRAHLEPSRGIIVGQPVHLIVEILVPNFFTESPDFPAFEVENVIVVLPEDVPANFNDQIGGESYAGIRRSYLLYPQESGDFHLPAARFTVSYAKAPPKSTQAVLTLPPLTFHAAIPAAAAGLDYFLPTTQLTIQQRWGSSLRNLRVGDTIERTITITTRRMQGMLIPPLPMDAPAGIRVYPGQPKVANQSTSRDEFISGSRIQSAKYLIQKPGSYTLPEIKVTWWNLNTNRVATATLPPIQFTAAPNPDYLSELPPAPEIAKAPQPKPASFWSRCERPLFIAFIILVAIVFSLLSYRYFRSILLYVGQTLDRYRQSETHRFRELIHACRSNRPEKAYGALLKWLQVSHPHETVSDFIEQSNDALLGEQINILTHLLFADSDKNWRGALLGSRIRLHRKRVSNHKYRRHQLPELNP